jgi:hypothetical protein
VVLHHRAVFAFLLKRYEVALDLETRSVELAPWPDSLANILAILLRLGEEARAGGEKQAFRGDDVRPADRRPGVYPDPADPR